MRFLGRTYGYYPTDFKVAYCCDQLCDSYLDIFNTIVSPYFAPKKKKNDALINVF